MHWVTDMWAQLASGLHVNVTTALAVKSGECGIFHSGETVIVSGGKRALEMEGVPVG